MEDIKKEEKEGIERSNDRAWLSSCRSWTHWRWVKAIVGLIVLAIVFGIGVKFGEFKSRFFDGGFGPFGDGHFYSRHWRGGCWEGVAPMMYGGYYQGNGNVPYGQNQNVPYGMMQGYYQGQGRGATTTPQAVPGQQP